MKELLRYIGKGILHTYVVGTALSVAVALVGLTVIGVTLAFGIHLVLGVASLLAALGTLFGVVAYLDDTFYW